MNNFKYWFGDDGIFAKLAEANEWDLGDHASIEESKEFVENGGQITMEPEKVTIVPDENWTFGDDASIEDIMNWMNQRNGGSLGPSLDAGVSAGVYSTPGGTGTGSGLTSQDLAEFGKVPGEMERSVARAVSGIQVKMDRVTVGQLVAPTVSRIIADQIA